MGIYTEDFQIWKSVDGDVIPHDKFVWDNGQPNNFNGNQDKIYSGKGSARLRDIKATKLYGFICDINNVQKTQATQNFQWCFISMVMEWEEVKEVSSEYFWNISSEYFWNISSNTR